MQERQAKTLEYRFFPIPPAPRFLLYAVIAAAGLFFQFIVYFPGHAAAGIVIIALGGLLMLGSTYTKIPRDLGFEDWKPVTDKEFQRVSKNYSLVRKAKIPVFLQKKAGISAFAVLVGISCTLLGFISVWTETIVFFLLGIDIAALLYPLFLSGHVNVHAPKELELKMERFQAVTGLQEELKKSGLTITPYFRFDKDSEGRHIPEDVRLMLEPKWKPEDLIGIQLQITINNGPNGAVPYMYAVCICRGKGKSYSFLENCPWSTSETSVIVETGDEGEFAFLILRQATENGGYHTTGENCRFLVRRIAANIALLQQK